MSRGKGSDSKYFTTTKRGEIHELKEELNHPKLEKRKEAVKKVIAAMTVGKDVSSLFTDVLNTMQSANVSLKKLVYLYLISYAKSNPDLAILAVNTFRRDANDPNPLIRALAIRTMGCIRVDKITEYLCEPLRRALKDEDPYVRKTAAVCVAKLYDINPDLAEEQGFLDNLRDMVGDSNPTVVANAVAALAEISGDGGDPNVWKVTSGVLKQLLAALNECAEWGQVFILDALSAYEPQDAREAESIIERITPRLQHSNSAVVMSAIRVVVCNMSYLKDKEMVRMLQRKMAPPLVTLLSSEPEIQYVTLRNINLIVQKQPGFLSSEVKVFFCKYNDPIYVKMEKLEIMLQLATDRNVDQVLLELKEYATEVDVDFVRKAVKSMGRLAIKLERAAERCINVLLELIQTKVNYVVQEAITVIRDIFRCYPNRYESIIATLCENLDTLDEPEAKASMIWIVGEYASRIENADELLETFLDSFHDETADVQLQLLTATVKLFLRRPQGTKEIMEKVLSMATEQSDNPDLRDRGFVYWRLLSSDTKAAKDVVLTEKPTIVDDTSKLDPALLDQLVSNISTLSSVYHKPPEAFVTRTRVPPRKGSDVSSDDDDDDEDSDADDEKPVDTGAKGKKKGKRDDDDEEEDDDDEDSSDEEESSSSSDDEEEEDDDDAAAKKKKKSSASKGSKKGKSNKKQDANDSVDLLDLGEGSGSGSGSGSGAEDPLAALGGGGGGGSSSLFGQVQSQNQNQSLPLLLDTDKGKGLRLNGHVVRREGGIHLDLVFTNESISSPLSRFAVQFNKNTFALAPSRQTIELPEPLQCGASGNASVPVTINPKFGSTGSPPNLNLQIALKNMATSDVLYFSVTYPFHVLFVEDGSVDQATFQQLWSTLDQSQSKVDRVSVPPSTRNLPAYNVHLVYQDGDCTYHSLRTTTGAHILVEINQSQGTVTMKCKQPPLLNFVGPALVNILQG